MKSQNSKNRTRNLSTLKQLKTQLTKLQGETDGLNIDINLKKQELNNKNQMITNLLLKIKKLENPTKPQVSEHALLRYIERVLKIDINEIKNEILNKDVIDMVDKLGGNGKYPAKNFKVVMKNNTVVTITNK